MNYIMGNIITKNNKNKNNKETVINAEFISNKDLLPNNPSKDVNEEYIWIMIHTSNNVFITRQEEGFVIANTEKVDYGYLWMRKKRNN